jgi:alpha-beta hydrolase superfamily lysophospholipase
MDPSTAAATPEAKCEAAHIKQFGWRPRQHDIATLQRSTATPAAYRLLFRAWRHAGFKARVIRELAHGQSRRRARRRRLSLTTTAALPFEQYWAAS